MSRAARLACSLLATSGVLGASLSQVACGGKSRGSDVTADPQGGSASAAATGGSAAGGSATGGSAAVAGTAGVAGMAAIRSDSLDDVFPWFDAAGEGRFPVGQRDELLHLESVGTPARASTSTHNVVDMLSWARFVQFSARASLPTRLLVSAGYMQSSYDYFEDREGDMPWPTTGVDVGSEWQAFSVEIADMQPPEMRIGTWPSFFLGFSVEQSDPVEVWLDDVRFSATE
jgi:hypothetical protein